MGLFIDKYTKYNNMKMTENQRKSYNFHMEIGWEFSHWQGESVIVQLWDGNPTEPHVHCGYVEIFPDGAHESIDL